MAKRTRKKKVVEKLPPPEETTTNSHLTALQRAFNNREVEHRITAIQAIRDAEIENLLSRLRLIRSYFSKEHLQTPAIDFFKQTLPNLSVIRNEKYGIFELEWKDNYDKLPMSHVGGRNRLGSLDSFSTLPASNGLEFSARSFKTNILEAARRQFPDLVMDEPSETQMLGLRDTFQTPGETSHRLSVGMTPKTLRLPKHGEMILSVRGSPLGVYREENLEAIHESEAGSRSHGDGS